VKSTQYLGNILGPPRWAADFLVPGRTIERIPALVDPSLFTDQSGITVTVAGGGAAANATSVPIAALTLPFTPSLAIITSGNILIPAGSVISFGAAGSKKFAKLTVDAKIGDVTLTTEALATALVAGDVGIYSAFGTEYIPSGTLIGRTYAERASGALWGPGDTATPDDELFLTAFEVRNARVDNSVALYKQGQTVKENYLPGYATVLAPAGVASAGLIKIRTLYRCILGTD
jgi:hypothetical protein